jgi:hypothetical protein
MSNPVILEGYHDVRIAGCQNRPLWRFLLKSLASLFLILPAISVAAQTVEIVLVNGRNGSPVVGTSSHVNVWVGSERKEAIAIPTDDKGVARLGLTTDPGEVNIPGSKNAEPIVVEHPIVKYDEPLRINVPYALCRSDGSNYSWLRQEELSTRTVLDHGYASPNTCGKAAVSPEPGQVILFVRPLTWWEKLRQ